MFRFFIAGAIGFSVDVGLLYFFTEIAGFWYLFSATLAFLAAFAVSFLLQKFWTFSDPTTNRIRGQATIYFILTLVNLFLNNTILYVAVEFVGQHYILGQMIASLIVAVWSFFIYRWLFRKVIATESQNKILIIINNLGIGGAERSVVDDIKEMIRIGVDVSLVTLKPEPAKSFISELPPTFKASVCVPFSNLFDARSWFRLIQLIKKEKPDVVITQLWFANTIGRIAARLAGVRKIFSFEQNVYDTVKTKKMFLADWFLQILSTKIIAVSEAVKRSLLRHGIRESKIEVLHNGVDLKSFESQYDRSEIRNEYGIPKDAFLYVFIGRLIHQKAVDILIQAFEKLAPEAYLLIAGQGKDRDVLEQTVSDLNLQKKIIFAGVRSDVPKLLMSSDCFVLPSRYEGLPLVLTEALAAGTAIVVSNFEAAQEIIVDGQNGLVVSREDVGALYRAMVRVKDDKALSISLARNAKMSAESLSVHNHVRAILRFVNSHES